MGQLSVNLALQTKELHRSLKREERKGVSFARYFTQKLEGNRTPYDEIAWELRTATIGNDKGSVIFEQRDVEVPADWSQTATNIVVSKYFHGRMGSPDRETSVAQLVHRVVDTIADWGLAGNYFKTKEDGENFRSELAHLMLHQKACFNSPVWFNVGVRESRGYGFYFDEAEQVTKKLQPGENHPQWRWLIRKVSRNNLATSLCSSRANCRRQWLWEQIAIRRGSGQKKIWTPNSICWTMAFSIAACIATLTLSCCLLLTCTIFRCLWDVCVSRSRPCAELTQR